MGVYLFTFLLAFVLFYIALLLKKNKILSYVLLFFAILGPSLVAGYRDLNIGRDMMVYVVRIYEMLKLSYNHSLINYIKNIDGEVDILYILINYFSHILYPNIHFFLGFYMFIVIAIVSFSCLKYRAVLGLNISFIFLFYLLFYYNISMSLMRQILGIAISFLSIYYALKRKIFIFYALSVLAYLAHGSAIINFIFYPIIILLNNKIIKNYYLLLSIGLIVGFVGFSIAFKFLIGLGFMGDKYDHYLEGEKTSIQKVQILVNILLILIAVISTYFKNNILQSNKKVLHLSQIVFFFLGCSLLLTLLSTKMEVANREAYYFFTPILVLLPLYLRVLKINSYLYYSLITSILLFNFTFMSYKTGLSDTVPYKSKILNL